MAYRVFISSGKGKNRTTMGSTPLKRREDVVRWVRRNPVGNYKTPVTVTNIRTKKKVTGQKIRFQFNENWFEQRKVKGGRK